MSQCPSHRTPVENCFGCYVPKSHRPRTRRRDETEHAEQAAFFNWCAAPSTLAHHPEAAECFAVPNGGLRQLAVARKLKAEGVKAGVEDILLLVARGGYHGLLLETKRARFSPSDVSDEQREWHRVHTLRGYRVEVCAGCDGLKAALSAYLSLPVTRVLHGR